MPYELYFRHPDGRQTARTVKTGDLPSNHEGYDTAGRIVPINEAAYVVEGSRSYYDDTGKKRFAVFAVPVLETDPT